MPPPRLSVLLPALAVALSSLRPIAAPAAARIDEQDRGKADGAEQAEERGAPAHAAVAGALAVAHRREVLGLEHR